LKDTLTPEDDSIKHLNIEKLKRDKSLELEIKREQLILEIS
jgi:hypothetical protein